MHVRGLAVDRTAWAVAFASAAIAAAPGAAQCNPTCPGGAVQQNDACGGIDPDPNGGCNFDPANYQDVGALSFGTPINICGTVGTFGTANRDLDWYTFTLAVPSRVRVTMHHEDGSGNPLPNATIFIIQGSDCDTQVTLFAAASSACPFISDDIALPAGEHVVIFTVNDFAPNPPACPNEYLGIVEVTEVLPAACGTGTNDCATESASPGCSDIGCCADVCAVFGGCCDTAWDALCVEVAIDVCGLFIWTCEPGPGAPANDCADEPTASNFDTVYAFDTTNANTDGPTNEPCDQSKDVWFLVCAPDDGELTVNVATPDFDSTIAIYGVGPSTTYDPNFLPDFFIGCVDIQGAGGELAVLTDAAAAEYYLIRLAGFQGTFGEGTVEFSFKRVIFNTGNTEAVNFDATNMGNFTLTNLGWSSGNLNAANPQRWAAQAFTVADPGDGLIWAITAIHGYGFTPGGSTNELLHYGVWSRTGVADPDGETQLYAGSVPFPPPFDIVGGGANEDHELDLTTMPIVIEPGDYWLTLYASNATEPVPPSNFGWFTNAQEGIPNLDPITLTPRMWRSQMWPVPGFLVYTVPPTTLQQQAGLDPNNVYNAGFRILGVKAEQPTCDRVDQKLNDAKALLDRAEAKLDSIPPDATDEEIDAVLEQVLAQLDAAEDILDQAAIQLDLVDPDSCPGGIDFDRIIAKLKEIDALLNQAIQQIEDILNDLVPPEVYLPRLITKLDNILDLLDQAIAQLLGLPPCPADLNGDGCVNGADLGLLLAAWCSVGPCQPSLADLNDDGLVDGADLGLLLSAFGPCPGGSCP